MVFEQPVKRSFLGISKALHLSATWLYVFSEQHMLLIPEFHQQAISGSRKRQMSNLKGEEVSILLSQEDRCQIKSIMKSRPHVNQR